MAFEAHFEALSTITSDHDAITVAVASLHEIRIAAGRVERHLLDRVNHIRESVLPPLRARVTELDGHLNERTRRRRIARSGIGA